MPENLAPRRAIALRAFLASLPAPAAVSLAKALEVDRLSGGKSLPYDLILEGLRPALRLANATDRTPTPLRMFCRPFEDLLTIAQRETKQKGRIARSSVVPVWNWLTQTLIPGPAIAFSYAIQNCVMAGKSEKLDEHCLKFWTVASQSLAANLQSEHEMKAARVALETDLVIEDAKEIALVLGAAEEITALQAKLPRALPSLTESNIWMLRDLYVRLTTESPDAAAYVGVVAMQRLERPWEVLKLSQLLTRQSQDILISRTDLGLVGELLFTDIETCALRIRAMRPQQFNAEEFIGYLSKFAAMSSGMVKEIEIRRDGAWGQRLMKDRASVAEVMEDFMNRAAKEIMSALPIQKSGAGSPKVPDLNKSLESDKKERSLAYAKLVIGCKPLASAASFGAANGKAIEEVSAQLKSYNEDIIRELRVANGERRARCEEYFAIAVALTAMFFSPEEAEFLRRRARAAVTQVAAE